MVNQTAEKAYTDRLLRIETVWWRRVLDPQIPYRWNLRRLNPGFVLDIGCGLGRNLNSLSGAGVGVDHNKNSVDVCRSRGFLAFFGSVGLIFSLAICCWLVIYIYRIRLNRKGLTCGSVKIYTSHPL